MEERARQTLISALRVAATRREELRAQLREITAELQAADLSIRGLEQMLGERRVTSADVHERVRSSVQREMAKVLAAAHQSGARTNAQQDRNQMSAAEAVAAHDARRFEERLRQNNVLARRVQPEGSTARAAQIVNEANRALTNSELFDQFDQRGWVEDEWTTPEAAVAQAARRAHQLGLIRRSGKRWTPLDDDVHRAEFLVTRQEIAEADRHAIAAANAAAARSEARLAK